ncbi:cytoplasmic protein [Gracilibacillus oryzae]|uniref:Cytoplasmic protein n=1 Tax=Gracilibacillus oryzae TaxID=1672701 RepID=A0A7C8GT11_9BACI|nr:DUF6434 domain-containing protein [Gracilibacillus oryzae]KAB8135783.1 cytoplasmic protein [Gracilibacillus oryzae]
MRPPLTKNISIQDFHSFYWLKKELQQFCRECGISTAGAKLEIAARIVRFIETGEIQKPLRRKKTNKQSCNEELGLHTVISENHRCSQEVRAFFKSIIPNFHFSTHIQTYLKQNAGKTYQDVVEEWFAEEQRKKDPAYKKEIAPQFEYNQFIRDFFADPENKGKTREEAIKAWNIVKKQPGSNKYER